MKKRNKRDKQITEYYVLTDDKRLIQDDRRVL